MMIAILALAGFLVWRILKGRQQNKPPTESLPATLTVTGVSPENPPSEGGETFCTVSGFLQGPDLAPTEVYQRWVLQTSDQWPRIGQEIEAEYVAGKAESHWWARSL